MRLLATSHDPEVRDGQRALALGRALYEQYRGIENGEALAMAYAEVGDFEQAKATQQTAIETAMWSGRTDLLPRLNGNLGRYQASEPGREPWPDDDPVFSPGAHAAPPSAP